MISKNYYPNVSAEALRVVYTRGENIKKFVVNVISDVIAEKRVVRE